MLFSPLSIAGAWLVEIQPHHDERGFFARTWCREEFAAHGICVNLEQANLSFNAQAGTLRGMHFSWPPSMEAKLVSCSRGRVHDVILDLRPTSATFAMHESVCLSADAHNAVLIPPGVAHGFQTLADESDVHYLMTERHRPDLAGGVRFDDPAFGIRWPRAVSVIAERDRTYPNFDAEAHRRRMSVLDSGA